MTDHNTTGRIDKPETVIGPITLGQSGGDAIVSTTFGAGTTVTPDQLGLTGTVELTAIVALPDCLSLNVTSSGAASTITISGVDTSGVATALPANPALTSIAHEPHAVTVHCKNHAIRVPVGTGTVTLKVAALT